MRQGYLTILISILLLSGSVTAVVETYSSDRDVRSSDTFREATFQANTDLTVDSFSIYAKNKGFVWFDPQFNPGVSVGKGESFTIRFDDVQGENPKVSLLVEGSRRYFIRDGSSADTTFIGSNEWDISNEAITKQSTTSPVSSITLEYKTTPDVIICDSRIQPSKACVSTTTHLLTNSRIDVGRPLSIDASAVLDPREDTRTTINVSNSTTISGEIRGGVEIKSKDTPIIKPGAEIRSGDRKTVIR